MDVETAVHHIDAAHRDHVGGDYEDDREAYRATLSEVASLAGGRAVEDVARYVAGYVRNYGERPPPGAVDEEGADAVRSTAGEVPSDSSLVGEGDSPLGR